MKSPLSLACCTVGLLCFALSAPLAVANPLKSIGSSLKKAGNALNPFKKSEAKPAPTAPAPAAKAKAKPTAPKPAPAKKKKPSAASSAKSKPAAEASKTAATAGTAATATATAATATAAATAATNGTDEKVDSTETPPETAPDAAPSDTTETPPAPEAAAAPVPLAELPFGIPVMGRKGYVRSPYAEDQGMVDVNDIPAGAKVKCPFTGKVFRVP
jgi:hypothetical protein